MTSAALSVSCVIPVYNGADYLPEALASVLEQTCPPMEIVVVNDGSTDHTAGVLAEYRSHVTVVQQRNLGPAAARNSGIRLCCGELIGFLDADDTWVADKLEQQVAAFESDPQLDVCTGLSQNFWIAELEEEAQRMADSAMAGPQPGVSTAMMVRKSAFDRVGLFDPSLRRMDTTEWFVRARDAGLRFQDFKAVLVRRRLHRHNISRQAPDPSEMFAILQGRGKRGAVVEDA